LEKRLKSAPRNPPVGAGQIESVPHHLLADPVPARSHGAGDVATSHGDRGLLGDQEHPGQLLRLVLDLGAPGAAAVLVERRDGFVEQYAVGQLVGDVNEHLLSTTFPY
jgi:hypothetical protein